MTDRALGRLRLVAQGLIDRPFARPVDAVRASGVMQGQDLPGVCASAALRSTGAAADVVADLNEGRLVRAYPMRETVFLMAADDARWVSELMNPPMIANAAKRRGHLGLDEAQVARAGDLLEAALVERGRLSRAEAFAVWETAGISAAKGRGYHLLKHWLSYVRVVYGPWNGADQDIVLASAWLPTGTSLEERWAGERIPAIADLLRRYLTSHGPATLKDFAWWTKLPLREIRPAFALLASEFDGDGTSFWAPGLLERAEELGAAVRRPLLLPGFDEYILGYQDRLFAMTAEEHQVLVPGNNGVFGKSIVVDGQVKGVWRRGGKPGKRALELAGFEPLSSRVESACRRACDAFPFVTP